MQPNEEYGSMIVPTHRALTIFTINLRCLILFKTNSQERKSYNAKGMVKKTRNEKLIF